MGRTLVVTVDAEAGGQRLDAFLALTFQELSRAQLQRLIEECQVLVDGQSSRAAARVRPGQRIEVRVPPPVPAEPEPQAIPLRILLEDEDLVVLDKPAGLVVHPAPGSPDGTLVNALLAHCDDLSGVGGVERPGIVHRLDRNTSGLMVVAKNDRAHRDLSAQFQRHDVEKLYLAFAVARPGEPRLPDRGRWDTLHGRHPVHRKRFSSKVARGKRAVSEYEVRRRFAGPGWGALEVAVRLLTGRTHQVRVHLADAGHPLLGDTLYGGRSERSFPLALQPARHALHAHKLGFRHPRTRELLAFESPLPFDLAELEDRLDVASRPVA